MNIQDQSEHNTEIQQLVVHEKRSSVNSRSRSTKGSSLI